MRKNRRHKEEKGALGLNNAAKKGICFSLSGLKGPEEFRMQGEPHPGGIRKTREKVFQSLPPDVKTGDLKGKQLHAGGAK